MKKSGKHYKTQWVGQFGIAHELSRRGYLVAFTTGNAPGVDLLCQSPSGVPFSVQVKSLSSKTFFLYQSCLLEARPGRFLVFVLVPDAIEKPPEYFVSTNEQFRGVAEEEGQRGREAEKRRGKPYKPFMPGIAYKTLAGHPELRDAWATLPK